MTGDLIAIIGLGAAFLCGVITLYGVLGEWLGWWEPCEPDESAQIHSLAIERNKRRCRS